MLCDMYQTCEVDSLIFMYVWRYIYSYRSYIKSDDGDGNRIGLRMPRGVLSNLYIL